MMSDADIIKALEEWSELGMFFYNIRMREFARHILSLINRQKAEIEGLNEQNVRLNKECDHYIDFTSRAKTEAIKEFAKRLKEQGHIHLPPAGYPIDTSDFVIYPEDIDILLKEMVNYE